MEGTDADIPMQYTIASSEAADGNMSVKWEKEDGKGSATVHLAEFLAHHGHGFESTVLIAPPPDNGTLIAHVTGELDWEPDDHGRYLIAADGVIIEHPAAPIAAGLLTGDCIPLVFTDQARPIYGVAHGSWKSTDKRIAEVMMVHLYELGSQPADIHVHLGPSIKAYSYTFTPDTIYKRVFPGWEPFVTERADGLFEVDIVGYTVAQLVEAEVPRENITISPLDTYSDPRYLGYSHRYATDTHSSEARFVTMVAMRG